MAFTRKTIRLPPENYLGKRIYFLTTCCQDRRPALSEPDLVARHLEILGGLATRLRFAVHAYCFMPDHLHLLCEGLSADNPLLSLVNRFKQQTAFEHARRSRLPLWQFKFYDHILRRSDSIEGVPWSIWMNPVRQGFCREPGEYPFSGSFTMPWKSVPRPIEEWAPPWRSGGAGLKPGATHA